MEKKSENKIIENNVEKYRDAILRVIAKIYEPLSEEEKQDTEFLGENFNQTAIERKVHSYFGAKGFSSNQYWSEAFARLQEEGMLKEIVTSGHRKTLIPTEKGFEEGRRLLEEKGLPFLEEEEKGLTGFKVVEIKGTSTEEKGDRIQEFDEFLSVARSLGVKQLISWKGPRNEFEARFIYEGQLFRHTVRGKFEKLEDYAEASMIGASNEEQLETWRKFRAEEKGWPDYESLHLFLKGTSISKPGRYQELWEPLIKYREKLDKNPELLPEYEPLCKTSKDWTFCILARERGWESYKDFLNFYESKKTIDLTEEEAGDWLLFYVGSLTFQQAKSDWLQGWHRFKEILIFWDMVRVLKGGSGKYIQTKGINPNWGRNLANRAELREKIIQYPPFQVPPYDPDCFSPLEWGLWLIANENGWTSYLNLMGWASRKLTAEHKLEEKQKENLFLLLAKMNPENAEKTELKTDTEGNPFLITEDKGMIPL